MPAPGVRTQNVLLAALAALAVGASGYAYWSVSQPHPSLAQAPEPAADTADPTGAPTSPSGTTSTSSPATTRAPVGSADDEGSTQAPGQAGAAAWVQALSDDGSDLMVVGDGHSNLEWQWLQEWASLVAAERPVEIRHWGEAENVAFNPAIVLSDVPGPSLTVWSASRAGTTIAQARELLPVFDRASSDPEAVLVSLGQGSGAEDVATELDALLEGLDDVPVLLVVAPGDSYPAGVADALAAWAVGQADRVHLVDLREAGLTDPTPAAWAQALQDALEVPAR